MASSVKSQQLRVNSKRSARQGFGLIELVIAVSLFGIITSFVLASYSRVGSQLSLSSLAYEVGLSLREAQSFGVSVREFRRDASTTFDVGYGLHFDNGNFALFALFADAGSNGLFAGSYNQGTYTATGCISTVECLSVFKLEKGNTIEKFCGVLAEGVEQCSTGTNPAVTFLDVTFQRPDPDAMIKTSEASAKYRAARIYLRSPAGQQRTVEVVNTGQISIK